MTKLCALTFTCLLLACLGCSETEPLSDHEAASSSQALSDNDGDGRDDYDDSWRFSRSGELGTGHNLCPLVQAIAAPQAVRPGQSTKLKGYAADDEGPRPLTFTWTNATSAVGSITNPASKRTTFRCAQVGVAHLMFEASDGDCTRSIALDVYCNADTAPRCGDGRLDSGETCDGNCPTQCPPSANACSPNRITGSPSTCDVRCVPTPIATCTADDGCCDPARCTATRDRDCLVPSDTCLTCETSPHANDLSCPNASQACDSLSGVTAPSSPMPGVSKATLCREIIDCIHASDCAQSYNVGDCLCGTNLDTTTCFMGSFDRTTGVCRDLIAAGGESRQMEVLAERFADPRFALGAADIVIESCDFLSCNSECLERCANGVVDPGEICDGNCPSSCDDGDLCTTDVLLGSAQACSARCVHTPVACDAHAVDQCCSAGCHANTDRDCLPRCGNGSLEPGETCDPPGSCPVQCNDSNSCTTDELTGNAANCNVTCKHAVIATCKNGDGCCAANCRLSNDSDCPAPPTTCGNFVVDPGETCDGDCPKICNDRNPCTRDQLTGSAVLCNTKCLYTPITTCSSPAGDTCCPAECSASSDIDCAPSCGNGIRETGELCDGDCPSSCEDGDPATIDQLSGSAKTCDVACKHETLAGM